jgi:hypothetical protein
VRMNWILPSIFLTKDGGEKEKDSPVSTDFILTVR